MNSVAPSFFFDVPKNIDLSLAYTFREHLRERFPLAGYAKAPANISLLHEPMCRCQHSHTYLSISLCIDRSMTTICLSSGFSGFVGSCWSMFVVELHI